jgi:hypothetical protein
MRAIRAVSALWLAAIGCNSAPAAPAATAEVDALWALAPEDARAGLVASPRAVARIEGHLVIEDGAERHALAAGDAYAFGEPVDAAFANASGAPCVYLIAVSRR